MTRRLLFMLLMLSITAVAEARTWRPVGSRAVLGDFQDVKGTDVIIRTPTGGIETIPYSKLPKRDKEVVHSNLISMGRQSDVERLKRGESGDSSEKDSKSEGMADKDGEEGDSPSGMRTWTDINGNKLEAELVSVNGLTVQLRTAAGQLQTFPVTGFSAQDQQYLQTAGAGMAGAGAGLPGVPANGLPGGGMPAGQPGANFPGLPNMPGNLSPSSGLPGAPGPMIPGMGAPGGPGMSAPGAFSGAMGPAPGMGPGSVPGMSGPMIPPGGSPGISGAPGMGAGMQPPEMGPGNVPGNVPGMGPGAGFNPGMSGPPDTPAMSDPGQFQPPQFQPPEFNPPPAASVPVFENVYQCDNCGAEFTEADGVKIGDACPKCSGGSSFRLRGGAIRGLVALAAMGAAGIGWVIKKASGKA